METYNYKRHYPAIESHCPVEGIHGPESICDHLEELVSIEYKINSYLRRYGRN